MSIAAQRFKFLDRETNIGTVDLTSLTGNAVYTAAVDSADSAIAKLKEGESFLSKMNKSFNELMDMVSKAKDSFMRKIKDLLNGVIDKLLSIKLPSFITKILDSLKSTDLSGVKAFFKDLLRVGSVFLCNNLDTIKNSMLGYSVSRNILSGLLMGLMLSWLDRYCKGFSREEVAAATNKSKLSMLFAYDGVYLTPGTALNSFNNAYADFMRYTQQYSRPAAPSYVDFTNYVRAGSISSTLDTLRAAEISTTEKKAYLAAIDAELANYAAGSTEYNNLLLARGNLINLPLVSQARRDNTNAYSGLNDTLGSIALNLGNVDLSQVNRHTLTDVEKSLLDKLQQFKTTTQSLADIQTRTHESGSFSNFDFSTLLPVPTPEELAYLQTLPGLEEAHRYNNLHPTAEVFTEASMPYPGPNSQETTSSLAPANPTVGTTYTSGVTAGGQPQNTSVNYIQTPVMPGTCHA